MKHLAVVELGYEEEIHFEYKKDITAQEVRRGEINAFLKECKRLVVPILKDSLSKERKFLRWKFSENHMYRIPPQEFTDLVENGELEVLPESSLIT